MRFRARLTSPSPLTFFQKPSLSRMFSTLAANFSCVVFLFSSSTTDSSSTKYLDMALDAMRPASLMLFCKGESALALFKRRIGVERPFTHKFFVILRAPCYSHGWPNVYLLETSLALDLIVEGFPLLGNLADCLIFREMAHRFSLARRGNDIDDVLPNLLVLRVVFAAFEDVDIDAIGSIEALKIFG